MIFLCNEEKKTSFEDFFKGGDHGDGLLETDKILGGSMSLFFLQGVETFHSVPALGC